LENSPETSKLKRKEGKNPEYLKGKRRKDLKALEKDRQAVFLTDKALKRARRVRKKRPDQRRALENEGSKSNFF